MQSLAKKIWSCTWTLILGHTCWAILMRNYSPVNFARNSLKRTVFSREICWSITKYEPPHDKTNKMTCVPSEDSGQPGHPPSLIRVFAVRMKLPWVLSYPSSGKQRLWSDWVNAQADQSLRVKVPRFLHTDSEDSDQARQMGWSESSLGAQVILLVLSCSDSYKTQSSYRIIEKWWHAKKTSFLLLLETV